MPKFILELSLGNDGVQNAINIKTALQHVISEIEHIGFAHIAKRKNLCIRDINGNTVGHYEVRE